MKSRSLPAQREVIDELTARFGCVPEMVTRLRAGVLKDDVLDLSGEVPLQVIRYCLLAMIASDIATVPYPEGRAYHLKGLRELAASYGLAEKKIIHLSEYADALMREFEGVETQMGLT